MAALAPTRCRRLVFSSSAAVYGPPDRLPIDESHALRPTTPYGETKAAGEALLVAAAQADPSLSVAILRYFNPAGAHPSGRIGEQPSDPPSNLVPAICEVALGRRPALDVHGDDYATPDGTGVRDYLHVMDLARAHLAALDWTGRRAGAEVFNLGTGAGVSVLEAVAAFERVSGRTVPLRIGPRRPGDVAACHADPGKAGRILGWRAEVGSRGDLRLGLGLDIAKSGRLRAESRRDRRGMNSSLSQLPEKPCKERNRSNEAPTGEAVQDHGHIPGRWFSAASGADGHGRLRADARVLHGAGGDAALAWPLHP